MHLVLDVLGHDVSAADFVFISNEKATVKGNCGTKRSFARSPCLQTWTTPRTTTVRVIRACDCRYRALSCTIDYTPACKICVCHANLWDRYSSDIQSAWARSKSRLMVQPSASQCTDAIDDGQYLHVLLSDRVAKDRERIALYGTNIFAELSSQSQRLKDILPKKTLCRETHHREVPQHEARRCSTTFGGFRLWQVRREVIMCFAISVSHFA